MGVILKAPFNCPIPEQYPNLISSRRLVVKHPGYKDDDSNELLALVATDGSTDNPGVQYGLVHTACAIFADNRFDGWLSLERKSTVEDAIAPEGLLSVGIYYFHVPSNTATAEKFADITLSPYPIVPNFREWTFPHARIPPPWKNAEIGEPAAAIPAKQRDSTCRLTNHREPTESAHIIPASEKEWFGMNSMDKYNLLGVKQGQEVINGDENLILLREDVHNQWDRTCFSIVPKLKDNNTWTWTAHVHKPVQELHALYHNVQLQSLAGVQHEYLLARFAWDMFPMLQGFLQRMVKRRLRLRSHVEDVSGLHCKSYCEGQGHGRSSPSRSASRRISPKRRHTDMSESDVIPNTEYRSCDSAIGGISPKESACSGVRSCNEASEGETAIEEDRSNSDSEEDPYGQERRRQRKMLEASLEDSDPHGFLRRKRKIEDDEVLRGRKRTRANVQSGSRVKYRDGCVPAGEEAVWSDG
jgi:hypothetical protein